MKKILLSLLIMFCTAHIAYSYSCQAYWVDIAGNADMGRADVFTNLEHCKEWFGNYLGRGWTDYCTAYSKNSTVVCDITSKSNGKYFWTKDRCTWYQQNISPLAQKNCSGTNQIICPTGTTWNSSEHKCHYHWYRAKVDAQNTTTEDMYDFQYGNLEEIKKKMGGRFGSLSVNTSNKTITCTLVKPAAGSNNGPMFWSASRCSAYKSAKNISDTAAICNTVSNGLAYTDILSCKNGYEWSGNKCERIQYSVALRNTYSRLTDAYTIKKAANASQDKKFNISYHSNIKSTVQNAWGVTCDDIEGTSPNYSITCNVKSGYYPSYAHCLSMRSYEGDLTHQCHDYLKELKNGDTGAMDYVTQKPEDYNMAQRWGMTGAYNTVASGKSYADCGSYTALQRDPVDGIYCERRE